MPFYPPSWVPKLPFDPPDSITLDRFMLDENYGRYPLGYSLDPFTCGLSGKTYSALDVRDRVEYLASGLSKELGFKPNEGTEWDKVIGVFSVNTVGHTRFPYYTSADHTQIDTIPLAWATHRLGGIQTPANAAYSAPELEHQLRDSGAKCLFTCLPLLDIAEAACRKVGIPENRIYILEMPEVATAGFSGKGYKTANDLINEGAKLSKLESIKLNPGDGAKRTAFLCYSSGTSGLPVSHNHLQ